MFIEIVFVFNSMLLSVLETTQCLLVKTKCLLNCLCLQAIANNAASTPKLLPPLCVFTITTAQNFNNSFTEENNLIALYYIGSHIFIFILHFILQLHTSTLNVSTFLCCEYNLDQYCILYLLH